MQPSRSSSCPTGVRADTVVEVSVRIGGDLHDVALLTDGIYDAGICTVSIDDARASLAPGAPPIVIERGLATITLRLVDRPTTAVPMKRIERRPYIYGAGSLTAHVGLVIIAMWLGSDLLSTPSTTNGNRTRRARISARFATEAQTTKRADTPEPAEVPITTDDTPAPVPSADEEENGGQEQASAIPLPVEPGGDRLVEPPDSEHGQQRRFDPDANAAFDTLKVGAYSTVSTGRLAGEQYGSEAKRNGLIVVSCDATTCLVLGGEEAAPIRKAVEEHLAEITACYQNESGIGGKKVEINMGLDNGKIDNLQVGGVGDVGTCVAEILKRTTFNKDA